MLGITGFSHVITSMFLFTGGARDRNGLYRRCCWLRRLSSWQQELLSYHQSPIFAVRLLTILSYILIRGMLCRTDMTTPLLPDGVRGIDAEPVSWGEGGKFAASLSW